MVERDVLLAKIATVDRCLDRIAEVRDPDRGLRPIDVQDIQELNLQRAVQAVLDLAAHVRTWWRPRTSACRTPWPRVSP